MRAGALAHAVNEPDATPAPLLQGRNIGNDAGQRENGKETQG
jgi:hypothetical protein